MPHSNRGFGWVMLQQCGLNLLNMSGAEIQAKTCSQRSQVMQLFTFRNPCSSSGSTENNGLHQPRNRQFTAQSSSGCLVCTDSRYNFDRDVFIVQCTNLLIDGAVKRCIPVMKAHNLATCFLMLDQLGYHLLQSQSTGANPKTVIVRQCSDVRANQ